MPQRTEQEIMRNWKYMDPPLVSVCCITFNHEPYIRDAIEGFLMQETDFPFEVIIHDDASTDRTAEIVREYAALYPQTIKPIFQTENQYSKGSGGFGFLKTYVWPQAQGEYFALCEGDDYWIDPQKIKKQVNYMKKNRNCTFCFHNARIIIDKRLKNNRFMLNPKGASKMYNVGKMALLGFIPTASGLYARFIIQNIPDWCYKSIVADYPLQLIASSYGYAYYINEPMSCYRTNVPNSATSRFLKKSTEEKIKYREGFIEILNNIDIYTNFAYTQDIELAKIRQEIEIRIIQNKGFGLDERRLIKYINSLAVLERLKLLLRWHAPRIFRLLSMLKRFYLSFFRVNI